jgi:lysozyme
LVPSNNAIDLIKRFEGCVLEAYQDSKGLWTIGWGTRGPGIQEGLTIKQATADAMLLGHAREVGLVLTELVGFILRQDSFDACTSFVYNVGAGAFGKSTMLRLIKARDLEGASKEFAKWDLSGGMPLPGLEARREAERLLFVRGLRCDSI